MKELSKLTIELNEKIKELKKSFPRLYIKVEFKAKGDRLNIASCNWEKLQEAILRHYLR
jgi:hypothetical protein